MKDRDLTPPQVARRLHVHVNTVREWAKRGKFTTARTTCTGRILIKASEVVVHLARRSDGSDQ